MIIHPFAQTAIYALVLAKLMAARLPGNSNTQYAYPIYLLSGLFAWSLFTEIINRFLPLFIAHSNLLKKVSFPRICLPIIASGSVLVNHLLLFCSMMVVFALLGHLPGIQLFWLPLLLIITCSLAIGIGLILGILNVFIRDISQIVPIILQLCFWLTPVVYSVDAIPLSLRNLLPFNPLTSIVQCFQNVMFLNQPPAMNSLAFLTGGAILSLFTAFHLFNKASKEMVEIL